MTDTVKIWLRVAIAAVGVTVLALVSSPGGSTESEDSKPIGSTSLASCAAGDANPETGMADWRKDSIPAGPVGIRKHPLKRMERLPDGSLSTELPILIEGDDKVTIAIVSGQRERALLFYGPLAGDAAGGAPGYERIRFHPCPDADRTLFTGGIRVEGPKAVRLKIIVADQPSFIVSLGRPEATADASEGTEGRPPRGFRIGGT